VTTLTIDASGPLAVLAVVGDDGTLLHQAMTATRAGLIESLPGLLARAVAAYPSPGRVAVVVGPGSFTGLRTSLALAQGFAASAGIPVVGVTAANAYQAAFPAAVRALWVVLRARPGRLFVLRGETAEALADADLPTPRGPVMLAGDAAPVAAAYLAARNANVLLTDARQLAPGWIARAVGSAPHHPLTPLYIDPPEARASAQRAAPV
jgi:tRNA threonylcarbamoyladenosine biosynthesis protein TsaB